MSSNISFPLPRLLERAVSSSMEVVLVCAPATKWHFRVKLGTSNQLQGALSDAAVVWSNAAEWSQITSSRAFAAKLLEALLVSKTLER